MYVCTLIKLGLEHLPVPVASFVLYRITVYNYYYCLLYFLVPPDCYIQIPLCFYYIILFPYSYSFPTMVMPWSSYWMHWWRKNWMPRHRGHPIANNAAFKAADEDALTPSPLWLLCPRIEILCSSIAIVKRQDYFCRILFACEYFVRFRSRVRLPFEINLYDISFTYNVRTY